MNFFPRLVGQPLARAILGSALESGRAASAYLFDGPPGCGKKTAAIDFAAALVGGQDAQRRAAQGLHPDVRLFAPAGASFKAEQVEEVLAQCALRPFEGARKVFILDRAEALTHVAANKLLKSIEEPPDGMTWVLVTTRLAGIPDTVASRCQVLRFRPLDEADLRVVLERELSVDAHAARDLAALSGGSVRLAAWYQGDEGKAQLREAEAFLEALASGSLLARLDWVESVQDDRRGLERLLDALWVLTRERWVLARGLPAELRLLRAVPTHGGGLAPETLEAVLKALRRCRTALARNANVPLALTALALAGSAPTSAAA
ncbi:MAG: ATP-binding protein [bacterium]